MATSGDVENPNQGDLPGVGQQGSIRVLEYRGVLGPIIL